MEELKAGDVVQLKSGGPKMTIRDIGDYSGDRVGDDAMCEWFTGSKNERAPFKLGSLIKVS